MEISDIKVQLRRRLEALGPAPAPSSSSPDATSTSTAPTRSAATGGTPEPAPFAEFLIDCEEDRVLRAVLVGMLREADRGR
jgi:hypothetical protein